jgi:hypothetical protein
MTRGLEPSEGYDGSITVHVLRDKNRNEKVRCSSYQEAINTVKRMNESAVATKIEGRDGEFVFTSDEMDIEDWETEWKKQKRRLSFDIEAHECPYDNVACVADDLCVQCGIDKVQRQL